jgi:enoyl-CoA hydratase/carnithine racemase
MQNCFKTIILKNKPPIAWIILNRPDKLNAINYIMLQELSEAIDFVNKEKNIRCLVIEGKGKAFSSGADLKEINGLTSENVKTFSRMGQKIFSKIEKLSKPVIASINGLVLGGGLELLLVCDFKIATENSEFGFPEIKLGLIPAWGGTQRLPSIIGFSYSKRLILTGDRITATEALKIGLIDRVVTLKDLESETECFLKKICNNPIEAIKLSKSLINKTLNRSFEQGLKRETKIFNFLINKKREKRTGNNFLFEEEKNQEL